MIKPLGVFALLALALLACAGIVAQPQRAAIELRGQVNDEDGHPVARAAVAARWDSSPPANVYTDAAGHFELASPSGQLSLSISKPGFFEVKDRVVTLKPGANEITLTLNHETELEQRVTVVSSPTQIDPDTTSHQETLSQHDILNTPVRSSYDLRQSLLTMPNVLLDAAGQLHVAGARQGQTEVLLDGFEINDPASGAFTPRVNVDAVQAATVDTGGYGAQYAHAEAGIVSLDTVVGDDKWRFGATNFIPGISFQEGVRFGNWYPRFTFSGPIKKRRAWFSEAVSLQHAFTVINGLPSGQNIATEWAGDNLDRVQVILTPKNILQGTFLFNRTSEPDTGLGPFTPFSTTTDTQSRRYFGSAKNQVWIGRTLLQIGVAADTNHSTGVPHGDSAYVVAPSIASGNFFQTEAQQSRRLQLIGDITSGSLRRWGTHTLSAGWNVDGIDFSQQANRTSIQFVTESSALADLAAFTGPGAFHLSNTQLGAYAQDLWSPIKSVVLSVGVRADRDRLIAQTLVEPRLALTYLPKEDGRMKFTLAWGEHYQPLNLTILGQGLDQQRIDTFYDPTGLIPVSAVTSQFVVPRTGLLQPRSYNTSAEWDEKIFGGSYIGAAYLLRIGRHAFAWQNEPNEPDGVFLLQNGRDDRFVSGEVWARHSFENGAEIMVDYARSRANSNEVLDPSVSSLIFAPQQPGPLSWDAPNRFLSSGWTPLPVWGLLFSYFFDYHTGFPFSAINNQQQLVGLANSLRYPAYLNLNVGFEKRFHFRKREWAVRLSGNNLTDHLNPMAVVNNVAAPNFRMFSQRQGLQATARLRLVTQH